MADAFALASGQRRRRRKDVRHLMATKQKPTGESKKPGRSVKEKRAAKQEKQAQQQQARKGWTTK